MVKYIIPTFLPMLWLAGCASLQPQKLDPAAFYKRDMRIEVNGHVGDGVLVVPKSAKYKFEIHAKGKLDLFTFTTCHREYTKEKAGESGWFGNSRLVETEYSPVKPMETDEACPVLLGGYEQKRGRHSWAFVDFETDTHKLPAQVTCNGSVYNSRGVTACQSKVGLIQLIIFSVPVVWSKKGKCGELSNPTDKKTFRFRIKKNRCVYEFKEAGGARWHRLTTIGYEKILIRER